MTVKLVARALDLIALFAEEKKPLVLTDIAQALNIPMSSCLGMIRTFMDKGYLYKVQGRSAYYPTRKLFVQANHIRQTDPIAEVAHQTLLDLVATVDETVVLGTLLHHQVLYLDVVSSTQPIRYFTEVGTQRPIHANSIGLAILSHWSETEIRQLLEGHSLEKLTHKSLTDMDALLNYLQQANARGYGENIGYSIEDLAAIAMAFPANGEWYGISIVGPMQRILQKWEQLLAPLKKCIDDIHLKLHTTHSL